MPICQPDPVFKVGDPVVIVDNSGRTGRVTRNIISRETKTMLVVKGHSMERRFMKDGLHEHGTGSSRYGRPRLVAPDDPIVAAIEERQVRVKLRDEADTAIEKFQRATRNGSLAREETDAAIAALTAYRAVCPERTA